MLSNFISLIIVFTQPLRTSRMWHYVNFQVEFNKFKFRVFFLLDWLPNQSKNAQSTQWLEREEFDRYLSVGY